VSIGKHFYAIVSIFAQEAVINARDFKIDRAKTCVEDAQQVLFLAQVLKRDFGHIQMPERPISRLAAAEELVNIARSAIRFAGALIHRNWGPEKPSSIGGTNGHSVYTEFVFELAFARPMVTGDTPYDDTLPLSALMDKGRGDGSLLAHFPDKTLPGSWFSVPADFFSVAVTEELRAIDKALATCAVGGFTPRPIMGAGLIPRFASTFKYWSYMAEAVKDTSEASKKAFCVVVRREIERRLGQ